MNDFPENELLSAYLDGELTAAERAEVERLLAANPAARQLLDELRTLSATLQALPPRKLGEDLSRQVLREAERRMLTEGEPGRREPSSAPPVPLARSVLRRFVNRRTLVWLALTAAIVIMITINERQHRVPLADNGDREVARAPAARDAVGPRAPSAVEHPSGPRRVPRIVGSAAARPTGRSDRRRRLPPQSRIAEQAAAAELAVRNAVAEKGQLGAYGPSPAKRGRFAGKAPGRSAAKKQEETRRAGGPLRHQPRGRQERSLRQAAGRQRRRLVPRTRQSGGANDADQKQAAARAKCSCTPRPRRPKSRPFWPVWRPSPRSSSPSRSNRRRPAKAKRHKVGRQPGRQCRRTKARRRSRGRPAPQPRPDARNCGCNRTRQQVAQSPPRQRVMFVFRVIGRDRPPRPSRQGDRQAE